MSAPRPPRALERVLERVLGAAPQGDAILGDLAEGWLHRRTRVGAARAHLWYLGQALSLLAHGVGRQPATRGHAGGGAAGLGHDVGAALRGMRRRPGFAVAVTGVLTVAVAAVVAAFSVVTGTREAARWWAAEERTVLVWPEYRFSRGQLTTLREGSDAFEAVGGILRQPAVIALGDRSLGTGGVLISPELFAALRARPVLGRGLTPEDARGGAEPVAVLGHGLWLRAFGGEPAAVGSLLNVNGTRRRVVGVMAPGAEQPGPGTELWLPLVLDPRDPDFWPARELEVAGVMLPGTPIVAARDDIRRVLGELARRFPFFFRPDFGSDATLLPSAARTWGAVATPLLLLLAGTALLLLVAAIDVGNLVLARTMDRRAELRVRAALGATRARVVRQILVEAGLKAALAGAAAWGLGAALAARVPALFPHGTPVVAGSPTEPALLLFVAAVTLLAWALMAAVPTVHFLRTTRRSVSPRGERGSSAGLLVVAQAALATVLLVTSALLLRTIHGLDAVPLGFDPADAVAVAVAPPSAARTGGGLQSLRDAVAEHVAAGPAVEVAGWISTVPLVDAPLSAPVNVEDAPTQVAQAPTATRIVADAGALRALGVRVVSGRAFTPGDAAGAAPVALVSRSLAALLWPDGQDPVGRRIAVDPHDWSAWMSVVGVVDDVRWEGLVQPPPPAFYLPARQAWAPAMSLVVRAPTGAAGVGELARAALAELAPDVPAGPGRSLEEAVREAQGVARILTTLLGALALLATLLGAVGLYGSLAGWVARRRVEIGTRLALGASPARLSLRVLGTGLLLTGGGVLLGLVGAAVAGRAIRSLLFGVSPLDAMAFGAPALILLLVGVVAAAVPALRAAAVPPAQALRG